MTQQTAAPQWVRPVTEYGPLIAFFVAYYTLGLLPATGILIAVTFVGLIVSYAYERRIPALPLITAIGAGFFGGLTLYLQDETFLKMRPTIMQLIFAGALLGGLAIGKLFLKMVLGHALPMTDTGWRKLTFRLGLFFIAMAALNEFVWRTQSTDFWVNFKVFGLMALNMVFMISQAPLLMRYKPKEES